MILKDFENKKCDKCGVNKLVGERILGCDYCEKEINVSVIDGDYKKMTLYFHKKEAEKKEFCSWKCCFDYLTDYYNNIADDDLNFITLPYVGEGKKGLKRFLEESFINKSCIIDKFKRLTQEEYEEEN